MVHTLLCPTDRWLPTGRDLLREGLVYRVADPSFATAADTAVITEQLGVKTYSEPRPAAACWAA